MKSITFQKSLKLATELLKNRAFSLLTLFAIGCFFTIAVEESVRALSTTQETERWVLQLSLGLWELFEGIMVLLILSWGIADLPARAKGTLAKPFATPYLASFFAEYLRMLAQVLLWGILLIIPGFIRYCQLMFVPLIALFSQRYRDGEVDALEFSKALTKKYFLPIVSVFFGATALQIGIEFLPHLVTELFVIPWRASFMFLSFLISIWTYSFMFVLFEQALGEE